MFSREKFFIAICSEYVQILQFSISRMPAEVDPPGWILKSWNCSFELSNVTTTFGKEDSDCLIPVS